MQAILDRACMDCPSHATTRPWYAYVAPMSWLVVAYAHEGREHLAAREDRRDLGGVQEGGMPLPPYSWMHPDAELSNAEKATLRAWSEARGRELESAAP